MSEFSLADKKSSCPAIDIVIEDEVGENVQSILKDESKHTSEKK